MDTGSPFTLLPRVRAEGLQARFSRLFHETKHRLLGPVDAHVRAVRQPQVVAVRVRPELADATVVVIVVLKDEAPRVPYFLDYYRRLGVEHFVFVDNQSTDGLRDQLMEEHDVSIFEASGDYKRAHFGREWVNHVLRTHCLGKWVSWVDADELLVFSTDDSAKVQDLIPALRGAGERSLRVMMLDMYSDAAPSSNLVSPGGDPLEVCDRFDRNGYFLTPDVGGRAFWIKGGVRGRLFFSDPREGPALNKSVMVLWDRRCVFLRGAHELWPPALNGGKDVSGILLHFKFTAVAAAKMLDLDLRQQHTAEYAAYDELEHAAFVDPRFSEQYVDARSAAAAGLFTPRVPS